LLAVAGALQRCAPLAVPALRRVARLASHPATIAKLHNLFLRSALAHCATFPIFLPEQTMDAETVRRGELSPLQIEGEMTIYRAAELHGLLQQQLAAGNGLEIDLSAVTEIDSAGAQLLVAAKKTAQAAGRELRLIGHSPAVLEVFELLNLGAYFGDPLIFPSRDEMPRGTSRF
jgi:anti-anti-sigma factor